jgi:hypothetical protein
MKTIIAGSRNITDAALLDDAVRRADFTITEVVTGGARGVDTLGFNWGRKHGLPVRTFSPDWQKYGKAAGIHRNREMAEYAEALIALWDGRSRGTKNMIQEARKRGLRVYVHEVI